MKPIAIIITLVVVFVAVKQMATVEDVVEDPFRELAVIYVPVEQYDKVHDGELFVTAVPQTWKTSQLLRAVFADRDRIEYIPVEVSGTVSADWSDDYDTSITRLADEDGKQVYELRLDPRPMELAEWNW